MLVYDADRFRTHTGGMVRSNIHRRGIFLNEQHKRTKYLRSSQSLPHRRAKNCPIGAPVLQHRRAKNCPIDAPLLQHRRARNFIIGELKSAPYTFLHLFYKPFLRNMMCPGFFVIPLTISNCKKNCPHFRRVFLCSPRKKQRL